MRLLPAVVVPAAMLVLAAPAGAAVTRLEAKMGGESGNRFTGWTEGVERSLIRRTLRRPSRLYVNAHTGAYPGGAARSRLRKPKS